MDGFGAAASVLVDCSVGFLGVLLIPQNDNQPQFKTSKKWTKTLAFRIKMNF
jgi:hypothetical protein